MERAAAAAVVIAVSFCPATGRVGAAGVPSDDVVRSYLDVLDTNDAAAALAVSVPGSPAWRYAEHQTIIEGALVSIGQPPTHDVITVRPEGTQVCTVESGGGLLGCATFGGWVVDDSGLFVSFTVDGVDITDRMGDPAAPAAAGPVSASVLSSYRTISDNLVVSMQFTTLAAVDLAANNPAYVSADGQLIAASDRVAPDTLAAGDSAVVVAAFPATDPGGQLIWRVEGEAESFDIEVVVPRLGDGVPATPPATTTTLAAATVPATTVPATTVPAATTTPRTTL